MWFSVLVGTETHTVALSLVSSWAPGGWATGLPHPQTPSLLYKGEPFLSLFPCLGMKCGVIGVTVLLKELMFLRPSGKTLQAYYVFLRWRLLQNG